MVARQFALGRAVAVAIVAILMTSAFPLGAQAQINPTQPVRDVYVVQGTAKVFQDNFNSGRDPTPFVTDERNFITVTLPIFQTGASEIPRLPVRWFFYAPDSVGLQGCTEVALPARSAEQTQAGVPANVTASFTVDIRDLVPGEYKMSVWALQNGAANEPGAPATAANTPVPQNACLSGRSVAKACPVTTSGVEATPTDACVTDVDTLSNDTFVDTRPAANRPDNNQLTVHFIKDKFLNLGIDEVRWCKGAPAGSACETAVDGTFDITHQEELREDDPTTVEREDQYANAWPTHVEVDVVNTGTWTDLEYCGGRMNCTGTLDGFPYVLNVTLTAPNGTKTYVTNFTNTSVEVAGTGHRAQSTTWQTVNLAGVFGARVQLDPAGLLRRASTDTTPDVENASAPIRYREFNGVFDNGALGRSPQNSYPYEGLFHIEGVVTFRNTGTAGKLTERPRFFGETPKVNYTIFIDAVTGPFVKRGDYTPAEPATSLDVPFDFAATPTLAATNYIRPGRHTLYAVIDSDHQTVELNESNNNFSVDIFIRDNTVPVFNNTPKLVKFGMGVNEPNHGALYPGDGMNFFINASDDDTALTVVVNATLDSNASVYRNYPARPILSSTPGRYIFQVTDFLFHDFDNATATGERWTLKVRANDSFGNVANATPVPFKLQAYPIHTVNATEVIRVPSWPNATIPWEGETQEPNWTIYVLPNWTGFHGDPGIISRPSPNQQNYTGNLAYNVTNAKRITTNVDNRSWTPQTPPECATNATPRQGPEIPGNIGGAACTGASATLNNTFRAIFGKRQDAGGPGLWNYSIRVKDITNYTRVINGTILINDTPPVIRLVNVSVPEVTPGQSFKVCATFSDDDNDIASAHVNFTRTSPGDGRWINLTLTNRSERTPEPGVSLFDFNDSIETGRGKQFGLGGTFNVTFHVRDGTGNWNRLGAGNLTVRDEDSPLLTGYGVSPGTTAQVGENVTFWAKASDATNVTVRLEVFRAVGSSELLFEPILLNESSDGNFTYKRNFTTETTHGWRLTPVDSVNRVGSFGEGTLIVRNNVGPKYEVRSPAYVLDNVRYGPGTPRIEVAVYDVEGVVPSSIDMTVAGLSVDHEIGPLSGNLNGFLVSYEVRANRAFHHNDLVEVRLNATDNSSEGLASTFNFTFKVDDVSPVARVQRIAPSYRDQPAHILNVSLASKFELTADDNDGLPTPVERIRYRILASGGPSSADTVYSGPFKINDAAGVYTGPRRYTIQFWAEDAVGNFNRNFNVTEVFVDDTPPALFQFFPQGRSINATFVDDRVGVNRSVVWYRVNNEPFVPLPLVEREGAWGITLPEGVKGDRASYYLQAWDKLDNTETFGNATAPYASFDVSNHEPRVRITSPVEGGRIFRTIDLTWDASDEDGDALVFTIFYKAPGRPNFVELAKIENSATRRYQIDTTSFPDGQYTFRLAASDGGFVKLSETTVTIVNRANPVGVVSVLGDALPGETMLVKAEITKAESTVEARLYQGDRLVGSYPMNDEGRDGDEAANDGFYSVRVPIEAAGDYRVEIFAEYKEDGQTKQETISSAATFSAKLTPGYIFSEYAAIIALIGLLAAVGIGVGVYVVMRRR